MKQTLLASTPLTAALIWTIALVIESDPLLAVPALLVGLGLLATATVATVGMIVVGGRWAHRLGLVSLLMTAAIAVVREIDPIWVMGAVATGAALVALLSPALLGTIRQLPSASGPPPRAIAPPLILLVAPALLGFAGNEATVWALLVVGVSAPMAAFAFSRVVPGGLISIRIVWPLLAVGLSPLLGWFAGLVAVGLAILVAGLAWDSSVKASYHPPREVGTTFPIPPELAPKEILDAADIDEKGRRR